MKIEALDGMFKLKEISQETISFLIGVYAGPSIALRCLSMQVLAKMNAAEAEIFIRQELTSSHAENRLRAIQCIHWYMPKGDPRFNQELIALFSKESDEEAFRFICYILQAGGVDLLPMLQPFSSIRMKKFACRLYIRRANRIKGRLCCRFYTIA